MIYLLIYLNDTVRIGQQVQHKIIQRTEIPVEFTKRAKRAGRIIKLNEFLSSTFDSTFLGLEIHEKWAKLIVLFVIYWTEVTKIRKLTYLEVLRHIKILKQQYHIPETKTGVLSTSWWLISYASAYIAYKSNSYRRTFLNKISSKIDSAALIE